MTTEITKFDELKAQVSLFVIPIREMVVTDQATAATAQLALKTIKQMMKQIEDARVLAVKPLNDEVKRINAYAAEIDQPLIDAEKTVKALQLTFANAEAARIKAERDRIEAERQAAEKKAQEERAKIEAEARAKREAEEKALREKQQAEREAMEAKQKRDAEALAAFGADTKKQEKDAEDARKLLEANNAKDKAEAERLAEKQRLEEQAAFDRKRKEDEAALKAKEKHLEAERPKNLRQVVKWRVIDLNGLEVKYLMQDDKKIGEAVRALVAAKGDLKSIRGVEIILENQVVSN